MPDRCYRLVFSGKLVEGSNPSEVLNRICTILGQDAAQVRTLFKAGAGAVIGRDLDADTARALQARLQVAGAVCAIEKTVSPPSKDFSDLQSLNQPPCQPHPRPQDLNPKWQPLAIPQQKPRVVGTLFKITLLVLLSVGGWWTYQTWFAPPTPAFTAYTSFAEAMVRGQYQKAAEESRGSAKEYADSWIQMTKPTTMKIYGREFSTSPPSVSSIAGDIAWIKRKKHKERKKSGTVTELQVEQTVCRIPPGVTSALCKWPVTFQHDVELELADGLWKVSGFKETRLTPQDK